VGAWKNERIAEDAIVIKNEKATAKIEYRRALGLSQMLHHFATHVRCTNTTMIDYSISERQLSSALPLEPTSFGVAIKEQSYIA